MDELGMEVSGFLFKDIKQGTEAEKELSAIRYIEQQMSTQSPENVLKLYDSLIDQAFFHTPVGVDFLRKIQRYLINEDSVDNESISPIPVSFQETESLDAIIPEGMEEYEERVQEERFKKKEAFLKAEAIKYRQRSRHFLIAVIALVIAIAGMFAITLTANSPTIINYENNLVDKYSQWEEDLEQRELDLRIREAELDKAEGNMNE